MTIRNVLPRLRNVPAILLLTAAMTPFVLHPHAGRAQSPAVPAGDPPPTYAAGAPTVHIPFTEPENFGRLQGMHVLAAINGGKPHRFMVDTGSVGVIVGADEVPNIDPNAPKGSITYSSSGIELDGVWTTATIVFPDAKKPDGKPVTAVVPVLAVRSEIFHGTGVNARKGAPPKHPHPHMFGIGFGRGKEAHPERNPFLNLTGMISGTMRRGYTITRGGYTLGIAAESAGAGYVYQKLTERVVSDDTKKLRPGLKDWETAPGSVTVGGAPGPTAAILMDTGLTNMMIANPDNPREGDLALGTPVTVNLLSGRLHYGFKVGDTANPATPRRVTWIKPMRGATVNTGLRALSLFDYLYDADGGYLALRPTAPPARSRRSSEGND